MRILIGLVIVAAAIYCGAAAAELKIEMFPLENLKPGLLGVGKTVIRGTKVEEFTVEIIDLVPKGGFDGGPMVLAKFSGPVVDFSNGIAGGYSGSPVYIDGKLLGAVSMAIPFTDTHVGGITPIQSMLKALPDAEDADYSGVTVLPEALDNGHEVIEEEAPAAAEQAPAAEEPPAEEPAAPTAPEAPSEEPEDEGDAPTFELENSTPENSSPIAYFDSYSEALAFNEARRASGNHRLGAVLCKTPLYFSNVSPLVMERFGEDLRAKLGSQLELVERPGGAASGDLGLFLQQAGDAPGLLLNEEQGTPPLVAGDAIAVSLIQGDIESYAIGTVTYSDDTGQFLCFGHPMLQEGRANFPIGKGYITWTHESIQRAFKDGVRLNTLGTMTKDHAAACGGTFNLQAEMIPVRLKIKDADLGTTKTLRFSVIRHKDFTPMLISMGLAQGAVEVLDRTPGGTLKLSYHIEGAGLKEPLRRTNYYSDDVDVISSASFEVFPISGLLETNIYREVDVTKVDLLLEITRNRVNASIDDAEIINGQKLSEIQQQGAGGEGSPTQADESADQQQDPGAPDETYDDEDIQALAPGKLPRSPLQQEQPGPDSQLPPSLTQDQMPMEQPLGDIPTFKPGDEIKVKVRLQPFRTEPVWREFSVTVPPDFPSGQTMVVVHGGGDLISFSELQGKGRSLFGMGPVIDIEEHDLDSILEQIMEWPLNNELLVTLQRPFDPAAAQMLGEDEEKPDDAIDAKYQMEWVIYNGFMLPVNIMTQEDINQMQQQSASLEQMMNGQPMQPQPSAEEEEDGECLTELPVKPLRP